MHTVIYIMGVSGAGKTTIGKLLAAKTGFSFYDADDFHSQQNKEKMKAAIPLTDEDRRPWLESIHNFVATAIANCSVIIACSALKEVYRNVLCGQIKDNCRWVFLNGDFNVIQERLQHRKGHYMPPELLQSQFDTLELPAHAIVIDIALSPEKITSEIINQLP